MTDAGFTLTKISNGQSFAWAFLGIIGDLFEAAGRVEVITGTGRLRSSGSRVVYVELRDGPRWGLAVPEAEAFRAAIARVGAAPCPALSPFMGKLLADLTSSIEDAKAMPDETFTPADMELLAAEPAGRA